MSLARLDLKLRILFVKKAEFDLDYGRHASCSLASQPLHTMHRAMAFT